MARPKSEDRRSAIIAAAIRVIAAQGLSAPTALIAKEASISNGSLFTYFGTKTELFNQVYRDIKTEIALAASSGLPGAADSKNQMAAMWSGWLLWSTMNPDKRRALAQLAVSEEITKESHEHGHRSMAGVVRVLDISRQNGAMREMPLSLVASILNAVADATVNFITQDPANAKVHIDSSFNAIWLMIA